MLQKLDEFIQIFLCDDKDHTLFPAIRKEIYYLIEFLSRSDKRLSTVDKISFSGVAIDDKISIPSPICNCFPASDEHLFNRSLCSITIN